MQYPANGFAIDKSKPTMIALQKLPAGVRLGQRKGLSAQDVVAVRYLYEGQGRGAPASGPAATTSDSDEGATAAP
jgi:hypothetical protein